MKIVNRLFFYFFIIALTLNWGCKKTNRVKFFIHKNLKKKWESSQDFKTPESVYYYAEKNILFVSNINGKPLDKDGNGFISKLSLKGKILKLKWVTGLNAPKGMCVYNGKLYVSDINRVMEIDIESSKIIKKYSVKKAKFLNDIIIDNSGSVYISDMFTNKIYRIKDKKITSWLNSKLLNKPNGLYIEKGKLLVGTGNSVIKVDLKNRKISVYIKNTAGIDGIVPDGKGNYIISDWKGSIHHIYTDKEKIKLLDTTPVEMNAADIEYIVEKKLLLVPTFFDNRVIAYTLKN